MINNISFLNFKSNLQNARQNNKVSNNFLNFKVSAPKLAPLAFDTISFSGKQALNRSLFEAFDNAAACQKVHDNAAPNAPIAQITTRVKSPYSIREKVASEFEHRITTDATKAFNPNKTEDIKGVIGDIVGARVTLRSNNSDETSKIIQALIQEVREGRLKITNIENYEPENLPEKYKYFASKDLEALADEVNAKRAPGEPRVKFKIKPKDSGYTALHLDVDLSDGSKYFSDFNGYGGEIQIIGADVQKLKEVEDACYKLQQDKTIRAGHQAYDAFSTYFLKHYNSDEPKYKDIKAKFQEYTAKAYEKQREKQPEEFGVRKKKTNTPFLKDGEIYNTCNEFLTIQEAGLANDLPSELDFNRLADVKYFSDALFKLTSN